MRFMMLLIFGFFSFGLLLVFLSTTSCSVNASKLDEGYVKEFAGNVRCAKGHQNKCWCFVASRKTGTVDSTGIGMALVPDDLCE